MEMRRDEGSVNPCIHIPKCTQNCLFVFLQQTFKLALFLEGTHEFKEILMETRGGVVTIAVPIAAAIAVVASISVLASVSVSV